MDNKKIQEYITEQKRKYIECENNEVYAIYFRKTKTVYYNLHFSNSTQLFLML